LQKAVELRLDGKPGAAIPTEVKAGQERIVVYGANPVEY